VVGLVDDEAPARHLDGRLKQARQWHRPVPLQGLDPLLERPRHPDRHPTRDPLRRERNRLPAGGVDERVLLERLRRLLAPVDGDQLVRAGEVDRHEAATAEACDVRLGHAERRACRDRGVNGIATLAEDLDRAPRRVPVDRCRRTAPAGGDRLGLCACGGRKRKGRHQDCHREAAPHGRRIPGVRQLEPGPSAGAAAGL
jgi:hypothetical protein